MPSDAAAHQDLLPTNIQTCQNRGSGTGILGTSLGVEAIGECQVLTNTYGAQYGGRGSVLNSVTRSGTNNFNGSLYEFAFNVLNHKNYGNPASARPRRGRRERRV